MSVSIEATAQSSVHYAEFVDFRNMRRFDDWCRTLHVTRRELIGAIAAVGEDAAAVRWYLRQRCS